MARATRSTPAAPGGIIASANESTVTSVRLPVPVLHRLQALATVMNTTPNSIVVTAIDEHVRSVVGSDAYRRAKDDHRKVLQESEKLLERVDNAIPVDFAAPRKTERAGQTVGGKRKVRTNTSPAKSARKTSASRTPRGSAVADNG